MDSRTGEVMTLLAAKDYEGLLEQILEMVEDLEGRLEKGRTGDEQLVGAVVFVYLYYGEISDVKLFLRKVISCRLDQTSELVRCVVEAAEWLMSCCADKIYSIPSMTQWGELQGLVEDLVGQFRQKVYELICMRFTNISRQRAVKYLGGEELVLDWPREGDYLTPPKLQMDQENGSASSSFESVSQLALFVESVSLSKG